MVGDARPRRKDESVNGDGQLDLNDLRPRCLLEDEVLRKRRLRDKAERDAWTLIAEAAEDALGLTGLSVDDACRLRRLLGASSRLGRRVPRFQQLPSQDQAAL